MKRVGLLSVLVLSVFLVCSANAITYQDSVDVQFTFNSTLSISLSNSDIVIGNLIPGQDDVSNTLGITVNTNNLYGYTLSATVGSATKDYRDLRHTNGTANFASLAVDSNLATLSNETSSVWGYATSSNGTTWSNYNGLPKYDDTEHVAELKVTDGAVADDTTNFRIGAKAIEGQLAGDYSNVINFKVVSNGPPPATIANAITMQNVLSKADGGCPAELPAGTAYRLVDSRDGTVYDVARLADGNCWLLDNLALDLTDSTVQSRLTSNTTNASDITLDYLINGGGTTSDKYAMIGVSTYWVNGQYDYSGPKINLDYINATGSGGYEAGKYGIYYNYCAATAGSFCYGNATTGYGAQKGNALEDICPRGWRMPTGGGLGEYRDLLIAYNSSLSGYINALHTPFSGFHYSDGSPEERGVAGGFWSSTTMGDGYSAVYRMKVSSSDVEWLTNLRKGGASVRCVLK